MNEMLEGESYSQILNLNFFRKMNELNVGYIGLPLIFKKKQSSVKTDPLKCQIPYKNKFRSSCKTKGAEFPSRIRA